MHTRRSNLTGPWHRSSGKAWKAGPSQPGGLSGSMIPNLDFTSPAYNPEESYFQYPGPHDPADSSVQPPPSDPLILVEGVPDPNLIDPTRGNRHGTVLKTPPPRLFTAAGPLRRDPYTTKIEKRPDPFGAIRAPNTIPDLHGWKPVNSVIIKCSTCQPLPGLSIKTIPPPPHTPPPPPPRRGNTTIPLPPIPQPFALPPCLLFILYLDLSAYTTGYPDPGNPKNTAM